MRNMCRDSPTMLGATTLSSSSRHRNHHSGRHRHSNSNGDCDPDCQPDCEPCPPNGDDFQQECENDPEICAMVDDIIASIPPELCGVRPPSHRREVVHQRSRCPPRVATLRRRMPSPEGDTVERITVIQPPQDHINIIIEKPCMPPPCVSQREEYDNSRPPIIHRNVVCVPPRSNPCPSNGSCNPCGTSNSSYGSYGGQQMMQGSAFVQGTRLNNSNNYNNYPMASSYGNNFQQTTYPVVQQWPNAMQAPTTRQQWSNVMQTGNNYPIVPLQQTTMPLMGNATWPLQNISSNIPFQQQRPMYNRF